MSFVIRATGWKAPIYFKNMIDNPEYERSHINPKYTPNFKKSIKEAQFYDTREEATCALEAIEDACPDLAVHVKQINDDKLSLRGKDGYVPLVNTTKAMCSFDYEERLWAEYEQLNTRRHKLKEALALGNINDPKEREIVEEQIRHMHSYMIDLLARLNLMDSDLNEIEAHVKW